MFCTILTSFVLFEPSEVGMQASPLLSGPAQYSLCSFGLLVRKQKSEAFQLRSLRCTVSRILSGTVIYLG